MMDPSDLFRRHHVAVFRYLLRRTGERAVAEELMQETFVRVVRNARGYEERGRERAWLFGIAYALVANWARGRTRRPTAVLDEPRVAADPTDAAAGLLLERVLAALPEADRDVLLLRELGGLDYAEIAETVGSTVAAVRSRLHRARVTARGVLTEKRPAAVGERR